MTQANTPAAQKARRLVAALEDFAEREVALIGTGEFSRAAEIQGRCQPLVEELAALRGQPGLEEVAPRIRAYVAARRVQLSRLLDKRSELERERARIASSIERMRRIGSYAKPAARKAAHRLNAAV